VAKKHVDGRNKFGHDERRERSLFMFPIITDRRDEFLISLLATAARDHERLPMRLSLERWNGAIAIRGAALSWRTGPWCGHRRNPESKKKKGPKLASAPFSSPPGMAGHGKSWAAPSGGA